MKRPDARFERVLASLALLLVGLISLANVIVRYLTDASFAFTEEFSVFLLVLLTFAGASVALRQQRHIRISFLEHWLSRGPRRVLVVVQSLCGAIVLGLIVWFGGLLAWQEYQWETLSPGLGLPQWVYLIWLPALCAIMLLRQLQTLRDRLREGDDDES
ncbi:TRAP transporter small permease [Halomonas halocynthiae]|uniref:TRAP transporter small permease n=1 Tax=Halomonas halocynthiae TaxID=176290 RepID=UPI0004275973|nr:TRAP transporter small permease [Halomonas halocynthiae]